mmetsp:Transcript_12442/g.30636  ORF Transcript_12442/g.30636 Transcript_12442/m.30636 type:complete len:337 (-) Transcript_12442:53-1063(-)
MGNTARKQTEHEKFCPRLNGTAGQAYTPGKILVMYKGKWFKGKQFDENRRLMYDNGEENKGTVDLRLNTQLKEFKLELKNRHTMWRSRQSHPPSGLIRVVKETFDVRGIYRSITPVKSQLEDNSSEDLCVALYITELYFEAYQPRWFFTPRKEFRSQRVRLLTEDDVNNLIRSVVELREGVLEGIPQIVCEYISHSDWLRMGFIASSILQDILCFRVYLRNIYSPPGKRKARTIVPVPIDYNDLSEYLSRSVSYLDKMNTEVNNGYHHSNSAVHEQRRLLPLLPRFRSSILKDEAEELELIDKSRIPEAYIKNDGPVVLRKSNLECLGFRQRVYVY